MNLSHNEPPPLPILRITLARAVLTGTPFDDAVIENDDTALKYLLTSESFFRWKRRTESLVPPMGRPRQAIADYYQRLYDSPVDPEACVTVTLGATEAVAWDLRTLARPGDKAVILEPYHDLYPSQCPHLLFGARPYGKKNQANGFCVSKNLKLHWRKPRYSF